MSTEATLNVLEQLRIRVAALEQAQAERREQEAHLQLIVAHLPAHVWTTDIDLRVTTVLGRLVQQLGIVPVRYLGKSIPELLESEGGEDHPVTVAHRRALAGETAEYELESGGHHFQAHVAPLRDVHGEVTGCVGLAIDISDRQRAERRRDAQYAVARVLSEATAFDEAGPRILEAIADCLGWEYGALWTPDPTKRVLRCAASWHAPDMLCPQLDAYNRRTSFVPGEGLPGHAWTSGEPVWIADASVATFPRLAVAAREGLRGGFALPIRIAGGVVAVCEFFGRAVQAADQELLDLTAALGSQIGQFVERTALERRLAREAELKRLQTGFLQSVSHELRTPLTTLQAGLGLLHDSIVDRLRPEERALMANARRNAARLEKLIDDLLTANQVTLGPLPLHRVPVDLRTIIVNATEMIHPLTQEKRQLLEFDLPEPLPVLGDTRRLEQVVLNLLANANRYTPSGTRIAVVGRTVDGDVRLMVRDDGPGLPADVLEAVFQPFYRMATNSGSGLGLAIVKSIVELHGGHTWAESEPGAGAVFHIVLPRHEQGEDHDL